MRYLLSFIFILLFTGCSQSASTVFNKDPKFTQNLQYTRVAKLVKDDTVKAIIYVTYLNSADQKKYDDKKQNFLISVYNTDERVNVHGVFSINGMLPMVKQKIDKGDDLYKALTMKNKWSEYYFYSFGDTKSKKIILDYYHPLYGKAYIEFTKE